MEKVEPYFNVSGVKVVIEDYTPNLVEDDVNNLVNFIVELFCVKNVSEV